MSERLQFELALDTARAASPEAAAAAALLAHEQRLQPLLERLLDSQDAGTRLLPGSLRVEVSLHGEGGLARLRFRSEFHAACRGLHDVDEHQYELPLVITGDTLQVDLLLPPRWTTED